MTERPTQRDLELDGIDDAYRAAVIQMYRDLEIYAPGAGVGPKTFEDAKKLARGVLADARNKREAAIAIINEGTKT